MAEARSPRANTKRSPSNAHKGKQRANNPPVGLVTPQTEKESGKKMYAYDPHLDPQLMKIVDERGIESLKLLDLTE